MTIQEISRAAIAKHEAKNRTADNLIHWSAGFTWNGKIGAYEVSVGDYIVATFKKLGDVRTFSAMHNGRIA